jgi:hypothetical protein
LGSTVARDVDIAVPETVETAPENTLICIASAPPAGKIGVQLMVALDRLIPAEASKVVANGLTVAIGKELKLNVPGVPAPAEFDPTMVTV